MYDNRYCSGIATFPCKQFAREEILKSHCTWMSANLITECISLLALKQLIKAIIMRMWAMISYIIIMDFAGRIISQLLPDPFKQWHPHTMHKDRRSNSTQWIHITAEASLWSFRLEYTHTGTMTTTLHQGVPCSCGACRASSSPKMILTEG